MKTIELNEQEAQVIFNALAELPGKVGFEAMFLLRLKFDTANVQQATAPAKNNDTPPQKK